jgi:hypothetical protein
MRIQLPISPRYVWPVLLALLVVDLAVCGTAAFVLWRAGERITSVTFDDMTCRAYSPSLGDALFVVSHCTRAPSPKAQEGQE